MSEHDQRQASRAVRAAVAWSAAGAIVWMATVAVREQTAVSTPPDVVPRAILSSTAAPAHAGVGPIAAMPTLHMIGTPPPPSTSVAAAVSSSTTPAPRLATTAAPENYELQVRFSPEVWVYKPDQVPPREWDRFEREPVRFEFFVDGKRVARLTTRISGRLSDWCWCVTVPHPTSKVRYGAKVTIRGVTSGAAQMLTLMGETDRAVGARLESCANPLPVQR